MADPSLYGARVREAWRAWRELPRFRIVQRVDLLAQFLYLVLTVLCIFYLIVITIDWYDGVIRLSDTFYRQIAIDGRYRDFPIWSFVLPEHRADGLEAHDRAAHGDGAAPRAGSPRRSPSGACWATTAARAMSGMDKSFSRLRPGAARDRAVRDADPVGGRAGGHRGRDQAPRRRLRRLVSADGGRWVIRTLFWNTQADWFAGAGDADGGALPCDDLRLPARTAGRTAAGLLYEQMVEGVAEAGVTPWKSRANTGSRRRARRCGRR